VAVIVAAAKVVAAKAAGILRPKNHAAAQ